MLAFMADEHEDTFEHLFREWESNGNDLGPMRAQYAELAAMPVGEATPLPGTLLRDQTLVVPGLTPVHHGLYENAEGPFWVPFKGRAGRHYSVAQLRTQVVRLRRVVAGLVVFAMVTISALIDIAIHWRSG